jgi:hypothetical protein
MMFDGFYVPRLLVTGCGVIATGNASSARAEIDN